MQAAIGFATLLLAGLLLAFAALVWFTLHRLRRPPRRTYTTAMAKGLPGDPSELDHPRAFEEWTLTTDIRAAGRRDAVSVPVWEVVGDDPDGPIGALTPGWGDSRIGGLMRIAALAPHCSRMLLWDPPGQGEAPGLCFLGTVEDQIIAALVRRAVESRDSARDVILYGWSLGAGSSIVAAARDDVRGRIRAVVAEGVYREPWTPARNVLRGAGYPWRVNLPLAFMLMGLRLGQGLRWRTFDRAAHASRLTCPLLALHGAEDEVCPAEDARTVADSAPQGQLALVDGAGHNDIWTDERHRARANREIADFLAALPEGSRAATAQG